MADVLTDLTLCIAVSQPAQEQHFYFYFFLGLLNSTSHQSNSNDKAAFFTAHTEACEHNSTACVETELKGHVNSQVRQRLGRERQNNWLLNPGAAICCRDYRAVWHGKHLCVRSRLVPFTDRAERESGRKRPLLRDTQLNGARLGSHRGLVMALQGYRYAHEPGASRLVTNTLSCVI